MPRSTSNALQKNRLKLVVLPVSYKCHAKFPIDTCMSGEKKMSHKVWIRFSVVNTVNTKKVPSSWFQNCLKTIIIWVCLSGHLQYESGLLNVVKWMWLFNKTNCTYWWRTSTKSAWRNYLLFFGSDSFGTDSNAKLMLFWTSMPLLWLFVFTSKLISIHTTQAFNMVVLCCMYSLSSLAMKMVAAQ